MKPLTAKQQRFVAEYPVDLNASAAAIRAGYSEKNAGFIGYQLLQKTPISDALRVVIETRATRTGWNAEKVLLRLGEMADADPLDIQDELGNYKPLNEWPLHWRRMLQESRVEITYERSKDGVQAGKSKAWDESGKIVGVKFPDRLKVIESIGHHVDVKAYPTPQLHQNVTINVVTIEQRLRAGRQRLLEAKTA